MTNARDAIGQSQVTWDPQTCINLFTRGSPNPSPSPHTRTHSPPPSLESRWLAFDCLIVHVHPVYLMRSRDSDSVLDCWVSVMSIVVVEWEIDEIGKKSFKWNIVL